MKKCAVIGSINMDLVVGTPRFPAPGETITGSIFRSVPGGKGANQAVALARLGVETRMAGMVGDDGFGQTYLEHFRKNGVNVEAVEMRPGATTGLANILVSDDGENVIVLVPGANALCDGEWLERALAQTAQCDVFLLQLELPLDTVCKCVERLHAAGKTVVLDPAPAVPLPRTLLEQTDFLTPNETELRLVTAELPEDADMAARIAHLVGDSDRTVIHKRGGDGAYIGTKQGVVHVPGFRVKAVDTTAAGDTFNAGFAAGLAMGMDLKRAVRLGNAAGALAVTAFGAQDGMPSLEQAEKLIAEQSVDGGASSPARCRASNL